MELIFRPRFYRDLTKLKGKEALNNAVYHIIAKIEAARKISEIPSIKKKLKKY